MGGQMFQNLKDLFENMILLTIYLINYQSEVDNTRVSQTVDSRLICITTHYLMAENLVGCWPAPSFGLDDITLNLF